MKKLSFIAILTIAFACLAADSLLADVFNFNTGQNPAGTQGALGSADTVYAGSFGTAFSVTPVNFGGGDTWVATPAGSNWISQHTDAANHANTVDGVAANPAVAASTFTYTATFNLAGFDLSTASFSSFKVAVDNAVTILLNGTNVGTINQAPLDSSNTAAFNTLVDSANAQHNFAFSTALLNAGINTLAFVVNNTPAQQTPEGLLVNGSLTISRPSDIPGPLPEPASIIAWALVGGIGAALGYRRRRNAS
jgi:hypothetical protein